MKMGHGKDFAALRRGWLLLRVGIMGMIMFARVTSEDQIGEPATGLLCVSDCSTCPVICAPPPPASASLPKPSPPTHHSPPESYYNHQSPPPPPPSLPPLLSSPPPSKPSYSWATPPPPLTYLKIPSSPSPPTVGPRDYPYPYYYFYASKAASLSLPAFFSPFFLVLLFSHLVFPCW